MKIDRELKIGLIALAIGMTAMQVAFHVHKELGIGVVFICIFVVWYAVIKGQTKLFKKMKSSSREELMKGIFFWNQKK